MLWKKDILRPTQPYFVLDTENFRQEIYLKQGISHFFTFRVIDDRPLRTVPDGCIDLFFEYGDDGMEASICGTRLKYTCQEKKRKKEVFGVRFMPGVHPQIITTKMRDVLEKDIPLELGLKGDKCWLNKLARERDFYQRIRIFIEAYTKVDKEVYKPYGKAEIVQYVKRLVYKSDGKIKVSELQSETGYSERYINKVFIEEMGFSPKIFCKIIQFQRALEFLNYGAPDKMTDAAVYLGYYDQPQFIRDFTKYAGITPKKYLKLVESHSYKNKIITNN